MNSRVPELKLALIGDRDDRKTAHRAIPRALELAAAGGARAVTWTWVHTSTLRRPAQELADYAALWVVPGSPYANLEGTLEAIRWARETGRPILGSCGGFQHMLIEFARHVAGLDRAGHAEIHPAGEELVITPLSCSLVEKTGRVRFSAGSRLREIYARDDTVEGYHCNYGLNSRYRSALEAAGLQFTAFDEQDEVRAAELPVGLHPFFIGTLFQSERAALRGEIPPLARALLAAAAR